MTLSKNELIIEVLLDRFTTLRLPRTLDIKEKVTKGGTLNGADIEFFEEVFRDIKDNQHLVEGNEELQTIIAKFIHLNKEITDIALANEK